MIKNKINTVVKKVTDKILPGFNSNLKVAKRRILFKKKLRELNIRPDDIFISTYMKSGTTWLQMILYQLTTSGEMNFEHIYEISPWIDKCFENGEPVKQLPSPRFFKTHIDYKLFPENLDAKFICVVRNGMDVAVSQYHQLLDYGMKLSFDESFNNYFLNKDKDKNWFHYTRQWQRNKNNFNILYIRYEDLKNDFTGSLYKIADFCNIKINDNDLPRIIERCSFRFMKQHEDKFIPEKDKHRNENFIRKGKSGQGAEMFNNQQINRYKNEFDKYLSGFELVQDYYPKT